MNINMTENTKNYYNKYLEFLNFLDSENKNEESYDILVSELDILWNTLSYEEMNQFESKLGAYKLQKAYTLAEKGNRDAVIEAGGNLLDVIDDLLWQNKFNDINEFIQKIDLLKLKSDTLLLGLISFTFCAKDKLPYFITFAKNIETLMDNKSLLDNFKKEGLYDSGINN